MRSTAGGSALPEEGPKAIDEDAWVRQAAAVTIAEASLYARTLLAVCFGPRRFVERWLGGGRAMNPLGFVATTAAISTLARELFDRRAGIQGTSSLLRDALAVVAPYFFLA